MDNKIKILIVDDRKENLMILENIISQKSITLIKAYSGDEALGLVLEHDFALILLDVQMPGLNGYETAELLRGNSKTREIPIIFITAINKDEKNIFKGYDSGAVDFLFKPINTHVLRSKVSVFVNLYRQKLVLQEQNKELSILRSNMIKAEQLKAINALIVTSNHKINQPLSVIIGSLDLLKLVFIKKNNNISPELLFRYVDRAIESAKTISEILEKMKNIKEIKLTKYVQNTQMLSLEIDESFIEL